jgi:outer membrane protein assembly factor BamA
MRKKSVIVFLLITLISLISITEVFAQNDSNWFYNKPIARIIFDGLVHINREDVTAVTNQFLGKDFTDAVYSDLISKIYALEFFEDIIPNPIPKTTYPAITGRVFNKLNLISFFILFLSIISILAMLSLIMFI